jgi:hypothetical protein
MWGLLKILKRVSSVSWMLVGEFNEVMWSFEHLSSRCRPERQMQEFREVLEFCDVFDLGFSGVLWTYSNLCYGGIQTTGYHVQRIDTANQEILVGRKRSWTEGSLDSMGENACAKSERRYGFQRYAAI